MRRTVQVRTCRQLAALTAVLWCFAAAADGGNMKSSGDPRKGTALVGEIGPVISDLDIDINNIYQRDIKKRYADQDSKMAEAVRLVDQKKFEEGLKKAREVRDELKLESEYVKGEIVKSRLAEAEALVARLAMRWGRDRLRIANEAFINNKMEEADINVTEAIKISPALQEEGEAMRRRIMGSKRSEAFQNRTAVSVANPHLNALRTNTQNLLKQAKIFYENKRYIQALEKIEQVYLQDPYNLEAVALAGQIYRVIFTAGYYRHRSDFELQAAYTNWQWIEPVFDAPEAPKDINVEVKGDSRKGISDRLRSTILREFKYTTGDAKGAVSRLRLILKNNGHDIDIQDTTSSEDAPDLGKVNLDLQNVSVADVLRYISLMSGLKYRVEPTGVRIGTSVETMYDRTYEIQPHVITWVYSTVASDGGSSAGGDDATNTSVFRKAGTKDSRTSRATTVLEKDKTVDDELKETQIDDMKVTSEMFKEYLEKHGIKFGPESSVAYLENNRSLLVKNTIDNLDAISQLLREQNALQAALILVELKSIEISDTDMEELGFDWTLGADNLNKNMNNEGVLKDPSKGGWMVGPGMSLRTNEDGERGAMNPLRVGFMDGASSTALINNLNIFPMLFGSRTPFGSEVPINISLTINALSQNTRTEYLSAPKVVAVSGTTARTQLTKSYHFPDDWDTLEHEIEISENRYRLEITPPSADFGEETELGIFLEVTPTVTETGAIHLKMRFEVTGTSGNDEYNFTLTGSENGTPFSKTFNVWKPIITERRIETDVDVYDSQPVVLGGSTDNRTMTRNDKIPFLGELPFIGRLFQTQSEKAERRNMILFVTARRLGTDGAAVESRNTGIPDFSR